MTDPTPDSDKKRLVLLRQNVFQDWRAESGVRIGSGTLAKLEEKILELDWRSLISFEFPPVKASPIMITHFTKTASGLGIRKQEDKDRLNNTLGVLCFGVMSVVAELVKACKRNIVTPEHVEAAFDQLVSMGKGLTLVPEPVEPPKKKAKTKAKAKAKTEATTEGVE
jgi:hypothetical protein